VLLTSLRDSSDSSVPAGEFSNCFVGAAAFAFALALPFVLKDGTFFIKLFILVELQCKSSRMICMLVSFSLSGQPFTRVGSSNED